MYLSTTGRGKGPYRHLRTTGRGQALGPAENRGRECPGIQILGGVTGAPEVDDDGFLTIGEKQAGAVANRQLRFRGMTAEQIKALVRKRVLHRTPARGVYRIAGATVLASQLLRIPIGRSEAWLATADRLLSLVF